MISGENPKNWCFGPFFYLRYIPVHTSTLLYFCSICPPPANILKKCSSIDMAWSQVACTTHHWQASKVVHTPLPYMAHMIFKFSRVTLFESLCLPFIDLFISSIQGSLCLGHFVCLLLHCLFQLLQEYFRGHFVCLLLNCISSFHGSFCSQGSLCLSSTELSISSFQGSICFCLVLNCPLQESLCLHLFFLPKGSFCFSSIEMRLSCRVMLFVL